MKGRKLIVAVLALAVVGGGFAYAAVPDTGGVIRGCRHPGSGILRVLDSGQSCTKAESPLDWVQSAGLEVYRSFGFAAPIAITAVLPDPAQHVLTLTVPPGSYEISTSVELQKDSGDAVIACFTVTGPNFASWAGRAAMGTAPGDSRWLTLSGTGLSTFAEGGRAELVCRQRAGATGATPVVVGADITAVRIGAIDQREDDA